MEEEMRMSGDGKVADIRDAFTCSYCPYFSAPGHYCENPESEYFHGKIDSAIPVEVLFRGCEEIPPEKGAYLSVRQDRLLASRIDFERLKTSKQMAKILKLELVKIQAKKRALEEIFDVGSE